MTCKHLLAFLKLLCTLRQCCQIQRVINACPCHLATRKLHHKTLHLLPVCPFQSQLCHPASSIFGQQALASVFKPIPAAGAHSLRAANMFGWLRKSSRAERGVGKAAARLDAECFATPGPLAKACAVALCTKDSQRQVCVPESLGLLCCTLSGHECARVQLRPAALSERRFPSTPGPHGSNSTPPFDLC